MKAGTSIKFDLQTMKWSGISIDQIKIWERIYPNANVIKALQYDIIRWIDKHKETKKVQKKRWRRFICNWLQKEHERNIR